MLAGMISLGQVHGQDERYPMEPQRPRPTVRIEPMDMTTATADKDIRLLVETQGHAIPDPVLEALTSRVSLKTWPEQALVPSDISYEPVQLTNSDPGQAVVRIIPTAKLTDRWYLLHVEELPNSLSWPTAPWQITLDDRSAGSRFRIGSEPRLASVQVCTKDPARGSVELNFSEPVLSTGTLADTLKLTDPSRQPLPCELVSSDSLTADGSLTYHCERNDIDAEFIVELNSGLNSLSEVPARPETYRVNRENLAAVGNECVRFIPDWK